MDKKSVFSADLLLKNRFFRPIYRRKISFRPAPRRKSRGKIDLKKNRGKIGKITDFSPKIGNYRFFHRKNRTCDSRAEDARHLHKNRRYIADKLKKIGDKSMIFDDFLRKEKAALNILQTRRSAEIFSRLPNIADS